MDSSRGCSSIIPAVLPAYCLMMMRGMLAALRDIHAALLLLQELKRGSTLSVTLPTVSEDKLDRELGFAPDP